MRYYFYRFGAILFYAVLLLSTAVEVNSNHKSNEFDEYVYYQGVQGRPGVDFPVFSRIPRTTFSCKQVPSGYYADLETDCQVFHICNDGSKISFLCPNGTIFQQSDLICEWWFKVNCTNSPSLYEESAEQLLEETWRRKQNRRPGYQNKLANEEKKKTTDERRKVQQKTFKQSETFPGSPNGQYFSNYNENNGRVRSSASNGFSRKPFEQNQKPATQNLKQNKPQGRGNQKYKAPISLRGRNDLNFDESSEESQVPAETASFYNNKNNHQNVIHSPSKTATDHKTNQNLNSFTKQSANRNPKQNSNKSVKEDSSQNINQHQYITQQYPNHKETYTEVHEPRFISTKAYTTGPHTIPPQTVSTNRIPLNNGKPFVVSTPKSSYNVKEFTTENFVYSPTVPPFTTTRKIMTTVSQNTEEVVTFSAPYSNVVKETHKIYNNNRITQPSETSTKENKEVQVVNSISGLDGTTTKGYEPEILSENQNTTEYVRIGVGIQQQKEEKPSEITSITSTATTTTKIPVVHRRYSAALSQANPNNACIDEVVHSRGTTREPTSTTTTTTTPKTLPTTKKIDFEIVVGRKRTEQDSKVIKISKDLKPQQPRSFQKAAESPIYRIDTHHRAIEKVTLKPTGFFVTKSFNEEKPSTKFGAANTYLPKVTTPRDEADKGTPVATPNLVEDLDVVQRPKPFELPPKLSNEVSLATTEEITDPSIPNYRVSSARPFAFESTIFPTQPTVFISSPSRSPKVYEHVTNMLNTIKDIFTKDNNETDTRVGLIVPPSAGPQTLHSLAVYFANALDGVATENENESTTENDERVIELLSIPTLNRYKDLFKEEEEATTQITTTEDNDLEGQHSKNGIVTPRVRQLAQVFTKALSSYLDDPDMFKKYLHEARPTEPTTAVGTTQRSVESNNTEEDELLNYSDADIKPNLPRLSTTPSVSPTWGYIFAPNNSSSFEYNSLSTDGENLQSADSQSFVSQFNNYIKEKHFGTSTNPLNTNLPKDHWTSSKNATDLWRDKLYTNPQAINEDLNTKSNESTPESYLEPPEISYELRSLPKLELNSTQVHGILIDFMNTTKNENSRLNRILSKLNTTQDEFLTKMREIEQNPLTRRLILLLISECANNVSENNHKQDFESASSSHSEEVAQLPNVDLFDSSRIAEKDKHVSKNSAIPKFIDHELKDEDEDTRALELLNSLYTIASRYGK